MAGDTTAHRQAEDGSS